jgi:hypothetical protein
MNEERQLIHDMRQVLLGKKDANEVMSICLPKRPTKKEAILAGKYVHCFPFVSSPMPLTLSVILTGMKADHC